jgi:hypothetical protein
VEFDHCSARGLLRNPANLAMTDPRRLFGPNRGAANRLDSGAIEVNVGTKSALLRSKVCNLRKRFSRVCMYLHARACARARECHQPSYASCHRKNTFGRCIRAEADSMSTDVARTSSTTSKKALVQTNSQCECAQRTPRCGNSAHAQNHCVCIRSKCCAATNAF